MTPRLVLWILILGMLGVGIFALRGSIRNSFKNVELKNPRARMLRSILGEKGYRYFVGIIGAVFITVSLGLAFVIVAGKSLRRDNPKTDIITISILSNDPTITSSSVMATEAQFKSTYEIMGDRDYDTYQHISFKNNYRSTLPDILWKMKNLESIDLTNNEFTELPLQQLKSLPKLNRLILTGNPIDSASVAQIQSSLGEIQVIKDDVQVR